MRITFRGVRGSVPFAIPQGIGHGCNTPCLEVEDERTGAILVLDAGSGIVGVNLEGRDTHGRLSLLLTHYHWDHLLGLPFFGALYQPGSTLRMFTPSLASHDPGWLDTVFRSPFFPVPYEHLPNQPQVDMVEPGRVNVPGFEVKALHLNHPGGALAYRIVGAAGDFVYATDHEFGDPSFDEPLAEFAKGASAIVMDAHFTPEEMPKFKGWGHSDWRHCSEFAKANGIQRLWLFHHKPGRTDEQLIEIRTAARRVFAETETASEGETIDV
jgi:phosphoribosyl 1,2-cyclic phosphodiesterase